MSASTSFARSPTRYALAGLLAAIAVLAGCTSASRRTLPPVDRAAQSTSTTSPSPTGPPPTAAPTTAAAPTTTTTVPGPPAFRYTVGTVTAADLPHSWHPGCPVGPDQLRLIRLAYWGFDDESHTGSIVVASSVVNDVVVIFRTLYQERFPIYEMIPVDAYGGDDNAAAAADDTSGFNCRYAVTNPPSQNWSVHAYGEAIDVNDVQNPYIDGSTVIPPAGAAYLDRQDVRSGMAEPGGPLVEAFASVGWAWGGRWSPATDYQHFSKTGG